MLTAIIATATTLLSLPWPNRLLPNPHPSPHSVAAIQARIACEQRMATASTREATRLSTIAANLRATRSWAQPRRSVISPAL
ncbi:hypothetical protein GPX89_32480 [Nocardia sp. ET3-3]|uniref:Uncharacterized protein n=1 Tax=Nocardia terrae TaxID=2675851 RepID=A0A7K1V628_9NOCA|nr:hypothetical protein [Nocardia terrae]MVU81942.1 hypothetical protein [Nocardia terrae]